MLPGLHENIANAIMVSLVAIEIVVGTTALRNLAHHHEKRYYMAQFFEIDDQKPTDWSHKSVHYWTFLFYIVNNCAKYKLLFL